MARTTKQSKTPDSDGSRNVGVGGVPEENVLGGFIRAQRERANLSLRQLSGMTTISNAYLSQIERGLHQPSIRVLKSVAEALGLSPEALLARAGMGSESAEAGAQGSAAATEQAILDDKLLEPAEKQALIGVYRSYTAGRAE